VLAFRPLFAVGNIRASQWPGLGNRSRQTPTLLPPACQTQIRVFKSRRHAVDLRFAETVSRRFVTPLRHRLADLTRYFTRWRSVQFEIPSNVQGQC
jgi:hypothetical protein